jgi:hypothetical protein
MGIGQRTLTIIVTTALATLLALFVCQDMLVSVVMQDREAIERENAPFHSHMGCSMGRYGETAGDVAGHYRLSRCRGNLFLNPYNATTLKAAEHFVYEWFWQKLVLSMGSRRRALASPFPPCRRYCGLDLLRNYSKPCEIFVLASEATSSLAGIGKGGPCHTRMIVNRTTTWDFTPRYPNPPLIALDLPLSTTIRLIGAWRPYGSATAILLPDMLAFRVTYPSPPLLTQENGLGEEILLTTHLYMLGYVPVSNGGRGTGLIGLSTFIRVMCLGRAHPVPMGGAAVSTLPPGP